MNYETEIASLVARLDALQANERRLIDELLTAHQQRDEMRKDAERYRWLRAANEGLIYIFDDENGHILTGGRADEAIDQAMAAAPAVGAA